ncbi:acyl-CoA-binding domain-containing protein 5A-like [Aulostomus maculatus]
MSSLLALSMEQEEEDNPSLEETFAAAVKVIRNLPEQGPFLLSDDMMLMFYSYYKQATAGPCNIPRPSGFWDSHGKAKWDAWSSLGNMTKEEAMKNYVEDIQLILETIPVSDEVSDLVQRLGNFYTEVEGDRDEDEGGDHEVDRRPFTRPFAKQAGYGDLWDDIQNPAGKDSVDGASVSSEEVEGSRENSETEQKEERSDWEEVENGDAVDSTEDEDKEEDEEWHPDPRLLMVENKGWRSDTRGSSSSVEPSVSSFTNGTHSSLNSEVEEEELACSIEPSVQTGTYMHFNGHLSDQREDVPEKNYRSTDSENEEFCDSMEHLATEEGLSTSKVPSSGSGAALITQKDLQFESNTALSGEDRSVLRGESHLQDRISPAHHTSSLSIRGSKSPKSARSSQLCVRVDTTCCCVSRSAHPEGASRGNVNEQIAAALLRLQHDMASVLQRLHSLEVLSVSQSGSSSPRQEDPLPVARKLGRPSWWPFVHSPFTVVLTALWPLMAYWLVQLYSQKRR